MNAIVLATLAGLCWPASIDATVFCVGKAMLLLRASLVIFADTLAWASAMLQFKNFLCPYCEGSESMLRAQVVSIQWLFQANDIIHETV